MFDVKLSGIEGLERMAARLEAGLSPVALTAMAVTLAREAGIALQAASVRACIDAIYDMPAGEYERTQALLDAHRIVNDGLVQRVEIDPNAEVRSDSHIGRELVEDYARYVHDGYTQWVYGRETGEFHPGRFWFDVAHEEASPVVYRFIRAAFERTVEKIVREATL